MIKTITGTLVRIIVSPFTFFSKMSRKDEEEPGEVKDKKPPTPKKNQSLSERVREIGDWIIELRGRIDSLLDLKEKKIPPGEDPFKVIWVYINNLDEVYVGCREKRSDELRDKSTKPLQINFPMGLNIMIPELLNLAKETGSNINIAVRSISELHYKDILSKFEECLKAGCKINIIIREDISEKLAPEQTRMLLILALRYPEKLQVRIIKHNNWCFNYSESLVLIGKIAGYRQQSSEDYEPEEVWDFYPPLKGTLKTYDKKWSRELEEVFKKLWKEGSFPATLEIIET